MNSNSSTYPGGASNKYAREEVSAILRYVNIVWDFVLNWHYSLQQIKNIRNHKEIKWSRIVKKRDGQKGVTYINSFPKILWILLVLEWVCTNQHNVKSHSTWPYICHLKKKCNPKINQKQQMKKPSISALERLTKTQTTVCQISHMVLLSWSLKRKLHHKVALAVIMHYLQISN